MMGETEFEQALEDLRAWATRGDQRAFERFYRAWLSGAAKRKAAGARLDPDEREDLEQVLVLKFVERAGAARLAEATSPALWVRTLNNAMIDFLRARIRRRSLADLAISKEAADETEDAQGLGEDGLAEILSADAEQAEVEQAVGRLATARRRAIVAFTWNRFATQFSAEDAHDLAIQARRSVAAILEILKASTPYDAPTSVAVFASDDELESNRNKCLDTYRKARARARDDLDRDRKAQAAGRREGDVRP